MMDEVYLGITPGDPNGIGAELILKTFVADGIYNHCNPVVYGTPEWLKFYMELCGIQLEYQVIKSISEYRKGVLNLKAAGLPQINIQPGKPDVKAGEFAVAALQSAIQDIKNGEIQNLLTCPIDKSTVYGTDFNFPGHTEFLASSFDSDAHMMLLVSEDIKVGLVTGHIPIHEVSSRLTKEKIIKGVETLNDSMRMDFGIEKPRIAVLGLNPHSGDNGVIGQEEKSIIEPAIQQCYENGIMAFGPYPADGFFGNQLFQKFDAVLAMYHDQGLIPFKQMAFRSGVNYTIGLPIVRTSPDHGTAYDIVGKGKAFTDSFVHALFMNQAIYRKRKEFMELKKNPLPFTKHKREKFSIGVPNLN